jgi:hypothetical protein
VTQRSLNFLSRHSGSGFASRSCSVTSACLPSVAAAHDLHLLEEQRAALAKHILTLLKLCLEDDRTYLAARKGDGDPYPALKPAAFRHGEMARDAIDFRVIKAVGRELVVGRQPLEYGRPLENKIGLVGGICGGTLLLMLQRPRPGPWD